MISFFLHLQGGIPRTTSRPPDASRDGAARLRLSGEVLVCVSLSAAECRLERFVVWQQQMLLYTHSNPFTNFLFFTPTQYGTFIHTHSSSAQPLTHLVRGEIHLIFFTPTQYTVPSTTLLRRVLSVNLEEGTADALSCVFCHGRKRALLKRA